jgi:prepilin signal peptidase PulO-like enzyme (type II secretory pathway)
MDFTIISHLIIGLLFGIVCASYTSSMIFRLPRNISLSGLEGVGEKPFCSHCKHPLKFYEYYTLLNWFFCRGKCNYCGIALSKIYFPTEAIIIATFTMNAVLIGFNELYFLTCVLIIISVCLSAFTYENMPFPKEVIVALGITSVIFNTYLTGHIFPWLVQTIFAAFISYFIWKITIRFKVSYDKEFFTLIILFIPLMFDYLIIILFFNSMLLIMILAYLYNSFAEKKIIRAHIYAALIAINMTVIGVITSVNNDILF